LLGPRGTKEKKLNDRNEKDKTNKRSKQEATHTTIEEVGTGESELIMFVGEEKVVFDPDEEGSGFEEYVATNGEIDECVIWYDWLADSVMTSHVTNQRSVLVDYRPANGTSVAGVSNVSANMEGCRSIMLQTKCGDRAYNLKLDNVLYIPSNHNSLISLGGWEQHGQSYEV
jgi:hypothetical protein